MFQKHTSHIAATLILLSVSAQPMTSFASEEAASAAITLSEPSFIVQNHKVAVLKDLSLSDIRSETKAALSGTQEWVKDQTAELNYKAPLQSLDIKIDRFQDSVKPAGRSMKASMKKKFSGLGLIQLGDQTMSVFALMLMMAFSFVIFLLGLSKPISRLGGRH